MKNINELMADISAKVGTRESFISLVFSLIEVFLKDFGGINVLKDYFKNIDNGPHCSGEFFRTCWYQKSRVDRETFDYYIKLTESSEFTPDSVIKLGHMLFTKNNIGLSDIPYSRKDDVELNQLFEKEWKCLFQNENNNFIEMIDLRLNQGIYSAITKQDEMLKKTFPDINSFRASEFGYAPSQEAIQKANKILEELKNY
jgi:hypothetical protein